MTNANVEREREGGTSSVGRAPGGRAPDAAPADEPFTKSLERMNRFQEPEARRIIADLGLSGGSRGLDAGCGVGLWALWLAEAVGPRTRWGPASRDHSLRTER